MIPAIYLISDRKGQRLKEGMSQLHRKNNLPLQAPARFGKRLPLGSVTSQPFSIFSGQLFEMLANGLSYDTAGFRAN
jgi:hypothetical protein